MARWCRGAAYVPWHGSTRTSSTRCRGRPSCSENVEPSRDGPSVRPCDRHAGGAAIKRRRQSSSSCLPRLRLASCREPLAASRLQRAACSVPPAVSGAAGAIISRSRSIANCKREDTLSVKRRLFFFFSRKPLRCQRPTQLKQLNSEPIQSAGKLLNSVSYLLKRMELVPIN